MLIDKIYESKLSLKKDQFESVISKNLVMIVKKLE